MEKSCLYCGTHFTPKRASKKYCNDNCKQLAYFKRNGLVLAGTNGAAIKSSMQELVPVAEKTDNVKYDNINVKYLKTESIVKDVKNDDETNVKAVKQSSEKLSEMEIILERFTKNFDDKLERAIETIREEFKVKDQAEKNKSNFTLSEEPENALAKSEPFYVNTKIKEPGIKYCQPCKNSLVKSKEEDNADLEDIENSQTSNPVLQTENHPSENTLHNKLIKSHEPICSLELMDDNKLEETEEELLYEIKEGNDENETEQEETKKEENETNSYSEDQGKTTRSQSPEAERINELEKQIEELKFLLISKNGKEKSEATIIELIGTENSGIKTLPQIEPDVVENEEDYHWIESTLIKKTENDHANNNAERLFADPVRYFGVEQIFHVKWITVRFRCLVESLLRLSNYSSIDRHTLFCVTDAFIRLAQSRVFQKLPASYPYTELIKELCFKLNKIANENRNSEKIVFRLPLERKAFLMSIRYLLIKHVPAIKFSEIDFTDEKSPFELMEEKFSKRLEDEKEETRSKKGWRVRFEAEKRKEHLKNAA
jgi:hypothetical protein